MLHKKLKPDSQNINTDKVLNQVRQSLNNYSKKKETSFDSLNTDELKMLCDILDIFREYLYK